MATEPILGSLDVSAVPAQSRCHVPVSLSDYWELTKPEINFLIAITAAAGFWMGSPAAFAHFPWMLSRSHALGNSASSPAERRH